MKSKSPKRTHKKRRLWLWGLTAVAFLLVLWGMAAEQGARYLPEYPKVNIEEYLYKEALSEEDYNLLFQQTGLARPGVDALYREGRQEELLKLQERLFAQVPIVCRANTILTREERIAARTDAALIPCIEEGDILITFNSHAFGWRNGHAAMVVDAKKQLTLEALVLGSDTAVVSIEHWTRYPSFVVPRLKNVSLQERKAIASLAWEQLPGVPYRLTAGVWERPVESTSGELSAEGTATTLTGTQCAHLVWYAYHQFGYDLDSDGGLIVTPRDLYDSTLLEVIQVYGMPPISQNGDSC